MFIGALLLGFGIFVAAPIMFLTAIYAYEDIFGGAAMAAKPAATGSSGTVVIPPMAAGGTPALPGAPGKWSAATKMGLAAVGLLILIVVLAPLLHHIGQRIRHRGIEIPSAAADIPSTPTNPPEVTGTAVEAAQPPAADVFGSVNEQELTNLSAINVATADVQSLPATVAEMNRGPEKDSAVSDWLEGTNMDFAFISAYDGFYSMTRDFTPLKRDEWDTATPQSIGSSLHDTGQDIAVRFGDASRLNNPTNFTYGFKTRAGLIGLLQITGYFTEPPSGVNLRYKVFQPTTNQDLTTTNASKDTHEVLLSRLEIAGEINGIAAKDEALARIATDAARVGDVKVVQQTVEQISSIPDHDSTIHKAALLLAKRGMRKQAVDFAKEMNIISERDETLSELAQ
jgi:hypothetical protein